MQERNEHEGMEYRHELKFQVSDIELEIIRYRLLPLMQADYHHSKGTYRVRSLYFDDLRNSCMQENEDGIDNRKKYRIRTYSGSDNIIKLEKKIKYRGMTKKESAEISQEDCLEYMHGRAVPINRNQASLEKEIFAEIKTRGMKPVSIVEYERTAFIEPRGNVRVTFDRNISGSEQIMGFLDETINLVPLLPKGQHILEVKYDELLPEYIVKMLEVGTLQRTSFSKYYYSRNYKNK